MECWNCSGTDNGVVEEFIQYRKTELLIPSRYTVCNHCGEEMETLEQTRFNDEEIAKAKFRLISNITN